MSPIEPTSSISEEYKDTITNQIDEEEFDMFVEPME
jgi:hypothetical protein